MAIDFPYVHTLKLRIWHTPRVPGDCFYMEVDTLVQAADILNMLAGYDVFQVEQHLRPETASVSGLHYHDGLTNEWYDWHHPETDADFQDLGMAELRRLDTILLRELKVING